MKIFQVFILFLTTFALQAYSAIQNTENPQAVVEKANQLSLKLYDQAKAKYAENTDPLIIVWSNRLSFYHHHQVEEYPTVPVAYTDLKDISHIILASFALFNPVNHFPDNMALAQEYQHQLQKIQAVVDSLPLTDVQKERQKMILQKGDQFLTLAMSKKSVTQEELKSFIAAISPAILQNIQDAAGLQLREVNAQMTKIQKQLTPQEKRRLFVVIPGFKAPRQENILTQYFEKYLQTKIDTQNLVYAEGLTAPEEVLTLVGNWQLESNLSAAFFHNPERMRKDLLADEAHSYLLPCKADPSGKQALICDAQK